MKLRRFIYTWDYTQSTGVQFIGGLTLYRTTAETTEHPHYCIEFGRLSIKWRTMKGS